MASKIQFVASIAAAPTVRLDLDTGPWRTLKGSESPPPPLIRALTGTLLQAGQNVAADQHGNRVVRLALQLKAAAGTAATEMQKLHRELERPANFLLWQPDTDLPPVFFRTFRSSDYAPALDWGIGLHEFTVDVLAEPYALGLRQTLSSAVVAKDPAAGTNPCRFDVAAASVIGDVPAPVMLTITSGTQLAAATCVLAQRSRGTPSAAPFLLQAEAMTQGTDTTTQANSTLMSGSGNNYSRCTFATEPAMDDRLTMTPFPAAASVDVRGLYRVFARTRQTSTGVVRYHLVVGSSTGPTITNPATSSLVTITDLQTVVQFPSGVDPVHDGLTGVEIPAAGSTLVLQAERVSGTDNLDVDCLLFMPADLRLAMVTYALSSTGSTVIDGSIPAVYQLDSSGNVIPPANEFFAVTSDLPVLVPAQDNRIYFIQTVETDALTTAPTTVTITPSYHPRYLQVRPVST